MHQVTLIVLDSVGIGALPDAAARGDEGADTLGNLARAVGGLRLPNLQRLGLGNIPRATPIEGVPAAARPEAAHGRMAEVAPGKDTVTGHWELMGLVPQTPFRTWPDGFPPWLIEAFCARAGVAGVLGNEAASGTEIIDRLGPEHQRTGWPIVYTSADPVLQIAAHEGVVPLETLYRWCELAFALSIPAAGLSRVIARPFVGEPGAYERTWNRHDFALRPPSPTFLDALASASPPVRTLGVGKIGSIFSEQGIDRSVPTHGNEHGIEVTREAMRSRTHPFVFTNLVEFDSQYGHRRDPAGYARALEAFDAALPSLEAELRPGDLLILTADHGNDPTYRGTDHTREYVPVLVTGPGVRGAALGTRRSFADLGRTICDRFGVDPQGSAGVSFLGDLGLPGMGRG